MGLEKMENEGKYKCYVHAEHKDGCLIPTMKIKFIPPLSIYTTTFNYVTEIILIRIVATELHAHIASL